MGKIISDTRGKNQGTFNPFPGLRPFRPDESELFFGRKEESNEVLSRLISNRFITVIGASGSGKSSLIYSGVIPNLTSGKGKYGTAWKVITMRPGNDPLGNLAEVILSELKSGLTREELIDKFRNSQTKISSLVEEFRLSKDEKVLFLIDQFEELFRFRGSRKERLLKGDSRIFANLIVEAVKSREAKINVIITMRSDFIGECAHFQGLTELINNSNYLIPHMSSANYREAIVGPVKYAGATIDEDLVNRLVDEIGEKTDQLPILQHALMRTWDHWTRLGTSSKSISSTDYDSVGQMSEAMSRHANEAYEELDSKGKEICEVMFKTITEKGNDNKGTRHPTRASIIVDIARCTPDELFTVVERFRIASRSFIIPAPGIELTTDSIIDVSHESLMRVWDRLAEWVESEASSVQMYQRLSEASEMFQQGKTTLWRPPDLQLAINWRNENRPTLTWAERFNPAFERAMVYLRTSEKEYIAEEENKIRSQKRQLRRSKITAIILGSAAIVSVLFMVYAFIQQIEADTQRQLAVENETRAVINEQLATEQKTIAEEKTIEATVEKSRAEAMADSARISEANAIYQKQRALINENKANISAAEARRQEAEAKRSAEIALAAEKVATQQREEATRLRMVSIAKSMAVKSVQLTGQGDLQALLAYQSYLFNRKNGGLPNDADIYMGLYGVAKLYGGSYYNLYEGHTGSVKSISFSPGKTTFFTSASDGKVIKWDLNDKTSGQIVFEGDELIEVLSVSPDGRFLACGNDKSVIRVFDLSNNNQAYQLAGHTNKIKSLAYSPNQSALYSSGMDGGLFRWNLETKTHTEVSGGKDVFGSLDISVSGTLIAAANSKGIVRIWDLGNGSESKEINSGKGPVNIIRFREGDILAVGYTSGIVELWDLSKNTMLAEIKSHNVRVTDIRFNEKVHQMATSSADKTVKIWNLDDLTEPPITLGDFDGFVMSLAYSPDGNVLLSGYDPQTSSNQNLVARPVHVDYMVSDICGILSRNFTDEEWNRYVGSDIEYEETCNKKDLSIRVLEKKGE